MLFSSHSSFCQTEANYTVTFVNIDRIKKDLIENGENSRFFDVALVYFDTSFYPLLEKIYPDDPILKDHRNFDLQKYFVQKYSYEGDVKSIFFDKDMREKLLKLSSAKSIESEIIISGNDKASCSVSWERGGATYFIQKKEGYLYIYRVYFWMS